MNVTTRTLEPDRSVVLLTIVGLLLLSLFLQHEFTTRQAALFLTGAGLGITLFHAAFGFSGGWRRMIRQRRSAGVRAHLLLLAASSVLFFPVLGKVFPDIQVNAALAPAGSSVLVGAFVFGIGMQLGGGCGSGTLYTVGGGHVRILVTLVFFIAGSVVGSVHIPWWLALPGFGKISLIESMGWFPALLFQIVLFGTIYFVAIRLERQRHGDVERLTEDGAGAELTQRLVFGPWPLSWGIVGLAGLGLFTLLVAGHPWSITFAFGLWGAKILMALGVDVSSWPYWSSGYPAQALGRSVLADTTSLMDFGIILGAVLAAALAGRFAPEGRIPWRHLAAAVVGGLLLGYGARLAFGCNIGAMLAGVASGSVHGWLWLIAGFTGNIVGVRLRSYFHLDSTVRS